MEHRLIIDNPKLAERIQQIARQEERSVEEVLSAMVTQYKPRPGSDDLPDADDLARQVRLAAYEQARAYWRRSGDTQRAAMTDKQLDEAFWLFDAEGVPRLKEDRDEVILPEGSLHRAGQVIRSAGFQSGQTDVSARSRQILNNEYPDYLLSRLNRQADDASSSSSS